MSPTEPTTWSGGVDQAGRPRNEDTGEGAGAAPAHLHDDDPPSDREWRRTLRELEEHQIELELQGSELRVTVEELEVARERYWDLFENAPVGYLVLGAGGQVLTANRAATDRLLEVSWARVKGRPLSAHLSSSSADRLHAHLRGVDDEHTPRRCEATVVSPSGATRLVRLDTTLTNSDVTGARFLCAMTDISDVRAARRVAQQSERLVRELGRRTDDVIYVYNAHSRRYEYVSPAFERLWGLSSAEVKARPALWLSRVAEEDRDAVRDAVEGLRQGAPFDMLYRVDSAQGGQRWLQDRAHPVFADGGAVKGVVGIARDVTESLRMREELDRSRHLEAVGRLASGVAHDVNNVLMGIQGCADLVLDGLEPDHPQRRLVQELRAAATRGAAVPRRLLEFSRPDATEPLPVDVGDQLTDAYALLLPLLGAKITLELEIAQGPLVIRARPGQLEQILVNLVLNARDAVGERSGTIRVCASAVDVDGREARSLAPGRYLRASVIDDGVGMTPRVAKEAIEPFFTTKGPGVGTGLGLSLAARAADDAHGRLDIVSEPGHGTTVTLLWPLVVEEEGTLEPAPAPPQPVTAGRVALLAEDDRLVRAYVRHALAQRGFEVLEAASGLEALQLADAFEGVLDLMVSDVALPGLSGPEVAARLGEHHPEAAVVFMSGHSREALFADGEPCIVLEKPFDRDRLFSAIDMALGRA